MSDSLANLIVSLVGNPTALLAAFEQVTAAGEAMAASVTESVAAVEAAFARVGAGAEESAAAVSAAATEQETAVLRSTEAQTEAMTAVTAAVTEQETAVLQAAEAQASAQAEAAAAAEVSATKVIDLNGMMAASAESAAAKTTAATTEQAGAYERLAASAATAEKTVMDTNLSTASGMSAAFSKSNMLLAGLAGFVGFESVKMASDFQTQMTRLSTAAGAPASAVQAASDKILQIGQSVGFTGTQMAEALYHPISAGLDLATSLNVVRDAAKEAQISGASLDDTVYSLSSVMKAFNLPAAQSEQTMASLNAIVGEGDMRFQDFNQSVKNWAPTAAQMGISINSMGAGLAYLTDRGNSAEVAATRMTMGISMMTTPSAQAAKMLEALGVASSDVHASSDAMTAALRKAHITQNQLAEDLKKPDGLYVALNHLKTALMQAGVSGTEADSVLAKIFGGGRSDKAIMSLMQNLGGLKDKYDAIQHDSTPDHFEQAWDKASQTFSVQVAKMKASIVDLGIKIGGALLPVVTAVVGALGTFFDWLNQNSAVADTLAAIIGGVLVIALGALAVKLTAAILKPTLQLASAGAKFVGWVRDRITGYGEVSAAAEEEATAEQTASERAAAAMESAAGSMEAAATKLAETLQLPATAAEEAANRIQAAEERNIVAEDEKAASLARLVDESIAAKEREAEAVQAANDKMVASEEATAEKFRASGTLIDEGLAAGIEEGLAGPVDAVSELNKELELRFHEDWEMESPSRKTMLFGENLDEGLAEGVRSGSAAVVEAVDVMAQEVVAAAEKITAEAVATGEQFDAKLAAGIEEGAEAAIAAGRTVATEVVAAIDEETALVKPVVIRTVAEPGAGGAAAAEGESAAAAEGAAAAGAAGAAKKGIGGKIGGKLLAGAGTVLGVGMVAQVADSVLPQNTPEQSKAAENPLGSVSNFEGSNRKDIADFSKMISDPGGAFNDLKKQLNDFPAQFNSSPLMNWLRSLPKTFSTLFHNAVNGIKDFGSWLMAPFKSAYTSVTGWWNGTFVPWFKSIPQKISSAFSGAVNWLKQKGEDIIKGLRDGVVNWWNGTVVPWLNQRKTDVTNFFRDAPTWLVNKGRDIIDGLKNGFLNWWNGTVVPWFNQRKTDVENFFRDAPTWLLQKGEDIIRGLRDGVVNWWNSTVVPWWNQRKSDVTNFFSGAGSWLVNAGEQILQGLLNGLHNMWNNIVSFVSSIGPWIAAHKGPIEYDRTLLQPHGQAIMSGLVDGLASQMPHLDAQLAAITGRVQAVGGDGAALTIGGVGGSSFGGVTGGGGVTVHVHVAGTVLAEKDLANTVQQALLRHGVRNTGSGTTYGFATGR